MQSRARQDTPPNRVRSPTGCPFAAGCSPPRLAATQLPLATCAVTSHDKDFHLADKASSRTHDCRVGLRPPRNDEVVGRCCGLSSPCAAGRFLPVSHRAAGSGTQDDWKVENVPRRLNGAEAPDQMRSAITPMVQSRFTRQTGSLREPALLRSALRML